MARKSAKRSKKQSTRCDSNGTRDKELLKPDDKVGPCKVISLIAEGGMAYVYKVFHEQLEVIRAIKILKPNFSQEQRSRMETEAKISANFHHPNILEVYGIGFWQSIPYMEMEYMDGPCLKELLDTYAPVSVPFAIAATHFVCQALKYAYDQNITLYGTVYDRIVHRDIKPANILLNSRGIVKLADFGIARPSDTSLHTVGAKIMGTFAYLSPEQLNGDPLDQRSDIYALGNVLYEMLSGSKTFPQPKLAELIQNKAKGNYVPIESTKTDIPKSLCTIVGKSLAHDREKRYPNTLSFDKDLLEILKSYTSRTPEEVVYDFIKYPNSAPLKGTKRKRTFPWKPLLIAGSLSVLAVLLVGVFLSLSYINRTVRQAGTQRSKQIAATNPLSTVTSADTLQKKITSENQKPSANSKPKKEIKSPPRPSIPPPKHPSTQDIPPQKVAHSNLNKSKNTNSAKISPPVPTGEKTNQTESNLQRIQQLELHIQKNELKKGLAFAESNSVNDGYFHLLRAKLFMKSGKWEHAENALTEAQAIPSSRSSLSREIAYISARIQEVNFMKKPNRENKILCSRKWQQYIDNYCSSDSDGKLCNEARTKITRYSEKTMN